MGISYDIEGGQLDVIFRQKNSALMDAFVQKMNASLVALEEKAKLNAPVRTGTLRDSIGTPTVTVEEGGKIVGRLYWGGETTTLETIDGKRYDYAKLLHDGTVDHIVRVSEGKRALHFLFAGKEVFAAYAVVKGVDINSFMLDTLLEMKSAIVQGFKDIIHERTGG